MPNADERKNFLHMKNEVGRKIVLLRTEKGLSQSQLADALGFPRPTLSQYETGQRKISIEPLLKIAEHFDVCVDYLLGRACRQINPSFEEAFVQADSGSITKGAFYEMLDGLSPEDRAAIHRMVSLMKK